MTHKDHIINILRTVLKGGPNQGEGTKEYLDRQAEAVLSYTPEAARQGEKKRAPKE